jgi:hypothetical protein
MPAELLVLEPLLVVPDVVLPAVLLVVPLAVPPVVNVGTCAGRPGTAAGRLGTPEEAVGTDGTESMLLVVALPLVPTGGVTTVVTVDDPWVVNPACGDDDGVGVGIGVGVVLVGGARIRTGGVLSGNTQFTSRFAQKSGMLVRSVVSAACAVIAPATASAAETSIINRHKVFIAITSDRYRGNAIDRRGSLSPRRDGP